jgi:hypothetical protein
MKSTQTHLAAREMNNTVLPLYYDPEYIWLKILRGENTMLVRANSAKVDCDPKDKRWHVHIQVGAEVIKRPLEKCQDNAGEDTLRAEAVETAKAEGYDLDASKVTIER